MRFYFTWAAALFFILISQPVEAADKIKIQLTVPKGCIYGHLTIIAPENARQILFEVKLFCRPQDFAPPFNY